MNHITGWKAFCSNTAIQTLQIWCCSIISHRNSFGFDLAVLEQLCSSLPSNEAKKTFLPTFLLPNIYSYSHCPPAQAQTAPVRKLCREQSKKPCKELCWSFFNHMQITIQKYVIHIRIQKARSDNKHWKAEEQQDCLCHLPPCRVLRYWTRNPSLCVHQKSFSK